MNGAHLHLMLNHIPILGSLLSLALLAYYNIKRNSGSRLMIYIFLVIIGVLTLVTFFTGEPAEEVLENLELPDLEQWIHAHEDAALWGLILTEILAAMAFLGIYLLRKGRESVGLMKLMLIISILNMGVMFWTANLGGQIRHTEIRR